VKDWERKKKEEIRRAIWRGSRNKALLEGEGATRRLFARQIGLDRQENAFTEEKHP
jgi:hypothetical protein